MTSPIITRAARDADADAISDLHAKTLGPGRFAKSAYRVREGTTSVTRFCRVGLTGKQLIAALRMTEVKIGKTGGALLLGPLAVDPDFAGQGYGRQLISETLEAARQAGVSLVILVGDEAYYGRFGFKPVPPGQILLPGPVDPKRLLAVELEPDALARYRGAVELNSSLEICDLTSRTARPAVHRPFRMRFGPLHDLELAIRHALEGRGVLGQHGDVLFLALPWLSQQADCEGDLEHWLLSRRKLIFKLRHHLRFSAPGLFRTKRVSQGTSGPRD